MAAEGRSHRLVRRPRLEVGLSDTRSIDGATVEVDGQKIDWAPGSGSTACSTQGQPRRAGAEWPARRFRCASVSPLPAAASSVWCCSAAAPRRRFQRTWPAPSFTGRLPVSTVSKDGFRARWSVSHLGRPSGQLWDSAGLRSEPSTTTVLESAFGVTLLTPVDAYRETDRAIKYRHHVHRPHLRGLPAVRDGDRHAPRMSRSMA